MCKGEPNGQQGQLNTAFVEMCDTRPPHQKLARLMERELGYNDGHIDSIALRLFILARWSKITALAYRIHDDG